MKFTLPLPISVNATYRFANRHMYKSSRSIEWSKEAFFELKRQIVHQHKIEPAKVNTVYCTFYKKDNRRYDLDNKLKGLLDALTNANVIKDDSQIEFLQVQKQKADKDYCELEVL